MITLVIFICKVAVGLIYYFGWIECFSPTTHSWRNYIEKAVTTDKLQQTM